MLKIYDLANLRDVKNFDILAVQAGVLRTSPPDICRECFKFKGLPQIYGASPFKVDMLSKYSASVRTAPAFCMILNCLSNGKIVDLRNDRKCAVRRAHSA